MLSITYRQSTPPVVKVGLRAVHEPPLQHLFLESADPGQFRIVSHNDRGELFFLMKLLK